MTSSMEDRISLVMRANELRLKAMAGKMMCIRPSQNMVRLSFSNASIKKKLVY